MSFLDDVSDQLNLRWAWEKVRRSLTPGDVWIDEIELAGFEVELERNLESIASEIRRGRFRLRPLRPMAFPKNPSKTGAQQVRQYFNVSVRDQVAWTAVVNVVGPHLDSLMPAWSYGNRISRSIWIDEEDGVRTRKIGKYRNSSGRIYLSFAQSWPVFRRHVFLATQAMVNNADEPSSNNVTGDDAEELSLQERLKAEHRCPFVNREYWNERLPSFAKENLFWCSVDLEKFYPSIRVDVVHHNIVKCIPSEYRAEATYLLASMLQFRVDANGWAPNELDAIGLRPRQRIFKGIPTGLCVAGFLANAALLEVDLEVAERLKKRNIAHFRFVDDHVVLAYTFGDLVSWIDEFIALLAKSNTGAKINPDKIEPEALAAYFSTREKSKKKPRKRLTADLDTAQKACKLNPKFPTPLMTKTLSLVSGIARTDFDLLEDSELQALADQLEHMLLVEIPEAEIPEKTRLSFAATRLMRLAECRLSNDARSAELAYRREALDVELANPDLTNARRKLLEEESSENNSSLVSQQKILAHEIDRAFGLLRKVLQERPDRVRLWTRAVQMCRQTGVRGVKGVLEDIRKLDSEHGVIESTLAAEYLMGNTLALLGSEAQTAALVACDPEVAEWRKTAAVDFLKHISLTPISEPTTTARSWFLKTSWDQYCLGLYCASLILDSAQNGANDFGIRIPEEILRIGELKLTSQDRANSSIGWAWWAMRKSLRQPASRLEPWVVEVGSRLAHSSQSYAVWRFFPFNVPHDVLNAMAADANHGRDLSPRAGWWHDALSIQPDSTPSSSFIWRNRDALRAMKNLSSSSNARFVSLHKWARFTQDRSQSDSADPRAGEWTALEIVRQIGVLLSGNEEFNRAYVSKATAGESSPICLHPANFRVPQEWMDSKAPTWDEWVKMIRPNDFSVRVELVPEKLRIEDSRYTPISNHKNALFESVNLVRGLGLLLYGLLGRNFELPIVWNGPGHTDVLGQLPKLLMKELTSSSWTLGVLQACMQPRAMENVFFLAKPKLAMQLDVDTLHDPIELLTPTQVCEAIEKCQYILVQNQLSTIDRRARQLTPMSVRQLSHPNWGSDFGETTSGGSFEQLEL
ncbi:MAG: hypothetical protein IPI24_13920 [Ignavibacteria bacterium]|nr:hypothetical protein [Ignavibacteria bacterium]